MLTRDQWIELADGYLPEQTVKDCRKYGYTHRREMEDYVKTKRDEWRKFQGYASLSDEAFDITMRGVVDRMTEFLDNLAPSIPVDPKELKLEEVSIANGDGAHYGISDFYDDVEAKLLSLIRNAIETKKPFKTEWFCSKKELMSGQITYYGPTAKVEVHQYMDTYRDLVDSAAWRSEQLKGHNYPSGFEAFRALLPELNEDQIYDIMDKIADNCRETTEMDYVDEEGSAYAFRDKEVEMTGDAEQDLELIQNALDEVADETDKALEEEAENIVKSIDGWVEYFKEEGV